MSNQSSFEKKFTFNPLQLTLSVYNSGLQYHPSQVPGLFMSAELWKAQAKGAMNHGPF
jgi:hypothetical protein